MRLLLDAISRPYMFLCSFMMHGFLMLTASIADNAGFQSRTGHTMADLSARHYAMLRLFDGQRENHGRPIDEISPPRWHTRRQELLRAGLRRGIPASRQVTAPLPPPSNTELRHLRRYDISAASISAVASFASISFREPPPACRFLSSLSLSSLLPLFSMAAACPRHYADFRHACAS